MERNTDEVQKLVIPIVSTPLARNSIEKSRNILNTPRIFVKFYFTVIFDDLFHYQSLFYNFLLDNIFRRFNYQNEFII